MFTFSSLQNLALKADYTKIRKEINPGAHVGKQVQLRWHALIAEFVLVLLLAAVVVIHVGWKYLL